MALGAAWLTSGTILGVQPGMQLEIQVGALALTMCFGGLALFARRFRHHWRANFILSGVTSLLFFVLRHWPS